MAISQALPSVKLALHLVYAVGPLETSQKASEHDTELQSVEEEDS